MAEMHEAIAMIHAARKLIQRQRAPGHEPDDDDLLGFLAESESFLAEGCGHRPRYWKPGDE